MRRTGRRGYLSDFGRTYNIGLVGGAASSHPNFHKPVSQLEVALSRSYLPTLLRKLCRPSSEPLDPLGDGRMSREQVSEVHP